MNTFRKVCILHALAGGAVFTAFAACGDDVSYGPEAGLPKTDATIDQSTSDAGAEAASQRLLMTYSAANGELVALNTSTDQIGRLSWVADFNQGYVQRSGKDYFLAETNQDLIARLDPSTLSTVASSWSVALSDGVDGGLNADPVQVVEVAANKAYVLRYNRNRIAIIDPSQSADAGAPTSSIDLSSLVQSSDGDGTVDMTGAFFDATNNRLYVVLGNIDLTTIGPPTYDLLCVATTSTMIAIDVANDTLVNLGGAGPGGGVVLNGYNPQSALNRGVVYDPANNRALVVSLGCNPPADGGVGATQKRVVEAVNLATNTTSTLLDANAQDVPNDFSYIDATHAVIQFGIFPPYISTYTWDPTQTTLGPMLATSPDVFDVDDAGHIMGPQSTFATDGAAGPINVISVTLADGGVTQLTQSPFLQVGGYNCNALLTP